jgi:hypothetical protein
LLFLASFPLLLSANQNSAIFTFLCKLVLPYY